MPITTRRGRRTARTAPARGWRTPAMLAGIALAIALFGGVSGFLLLSGPSAAPAGQNAAFAIGGPFTLIDGDGRQVTDRDFRGKYLLVYFGYTFCPDACPTTLNEVAVAMQELGPAASRVQPLFVTVDPRRDTPRAARARGRSDQESRAQVRLHRDAR